MKTFVDEVEVRMSAWVTKTLVRIQCPENLRVPLQGSSLKVKSGPKVRSKDVADGKQVNIPVLILYYVKGRRVNMLV